MAYFTPPPPSATTRQLGRSRSYTLASLPTRLRHWHAPRANRWEHLRQTAYSLAVQWLDPAGATTDCLDAGDTRWIAPGTRRRVWRMDAQTRFELEIHADDSTPVSAPQGARVAWLDDVERVQVEDGEAFRRLMNRLVVGDQRLVTGRLDDREALHAALTELDHTVFWHPLEQFAGRFAALVARADAPVGLGDYLGRDHAVIEAALAGALRGNAEQTGWFNATLARHLASEEELLFPAYLRAGGRAGWVRGLCNEHRHLRCDLSGLSEPATRRRFLLLLDGHDEKEEQIVYPDLIARLGSEVGSLTTRAMLYPIPVEIG